MTWRETDLAGVLWWFRGKDVVDDYDGERGSPPDALGIPDGAALSDGSVVIAFPDRTDTAAGRPPGAAAGPARFWIGTPEAEPDQP